MADTYFQSREKKKHDKTFPAYDRFQSSDVPPWTIKTLFLEKKIEHALSLDELLGRLLESLRRRFKSCTPTFFNPLAVDRNETCIVRKKGNG